MREEEKGLGFGPNPYRMVLDTRNVHKACQSCVEFPIQRAKALQQADVLVSWHP